MVTYLVIFTSYSRLHSSIGKYLSMLLLLFFSIRHCVPLFAFPKYFVRLLLFWVLYSCSMSDNLLFHEINGVGHVLSLCCFNQASGICGCWFNSLAVRLIPYLFQVTRSNHIKLEISFNLKNIRYLWFWESKCINMTFHWSEILYHQLLRSNGWFFSFDETLFC